MLMMNSFVSFYYTLNYGSFTSKMVAHHLKKGRNIVCLESINFFYGNSEGLHINGKTKLVKLFDRVKSSFLSLYISIGFAEFKLVAREICKLPSFSSTSLFRKIDVGGTGYITRYYCIPT